MPKRYNTKNDIITPFHVMAKPVGPICNLDCTYCFYLEKKSLYHNKSNTYTMSDEILELFIKQKIEASSESIINFTWQGGEPTLAGIDYYRKILKFQKQYSNGKKIENAIQTNGILLNDDWCEFLNRHDFLVGISVDGPQNIHDKFRINKGGQGTFENVMHGIGLLQKHKVEFNILTCVHHYNADYPFEVYGFLKELGSRFIQFIPIVERESTENNKHHMSDWSVGSDQYGKFLITIFDHWIKNDVGQYFVQIFDVALEAWCGLIPGLCLFTEKCGRAIVIDYNGDIYSCDHFVHKDYLIGNIQKDHLTNIVESQKQKTFGNKKLDTLPQYCIECDYQFVCCGECPKNRFINSSNGISNLNYLCQGLKLFFKHIDPYMLFMVNELNNNRAPANVMNWSKEQM
ncbi:anaerobic sulfatase-maturation protein [Candidatus Neomarinimicrobiota bacterium]